MVEVRQFLRAWRVWAIEVLPDKRGVQVTFGIDGHEPIRFQTRRFAVGKRGTKSAALAKFASKAGYGAVEEVFQYICNLPSDLEGEVFPFGPFGRIARDTLPAPQLTCLSPDTQGS